MSLEGQIIQQTVMSTEQFREFIAEVRETNRILLERTFPKKLTPYTLKELATAMKVHDKTVLNWIHDDKILSKRGIESYKKAGHNYVIMVDEKELNK